MKEVSLEERFRMFYTKMVEELEATIDLYFIDKDITPIKDSLEIVKIEGDGKKNYGGLSVHYDKEFIVEAKIFLKKDNDKGGKKLQFEIIPHYQFKGFK